MFYDPILLLITLVFMGLGLLVSSRLKNRFAFYSRIRLGSGLSGREVAEKMLHDHGIYDVRVQSVEGTLTDHYNPATRTVNLSPQVYHERTVAAAAVAAHECGHAVQHKTAYSWLKLRSGLVPVVQLASQAMAFLTFGLAFIAMSSPTMLNSMLLLFIILQGTITLFSVITLPVEIDASRRALAWLDTAGITYQQEGEQARDALKWAAYTYVVNALASIATLLYYIWRFMGNRREE